MSTERDAVTFFIVGPERAGSTLLRLILGHHPDICRCDEMNYVTPALGRGFDTAAYATYLRRHPEFAVAGFGIDTALSFEGLARSFLVQRQNQDGCSTVGATVHHRFDALDEIWPDAKFIFLNRDPRDVARSCVRMGWAGTCWHGTAGWLEAQWMWERLKSRLEPKQIIEIRYEDLVSRSVPVLSELCTFLGVDWAPQMLEIEHDTTYQRPNPRLAESWRQRASKAQIIEVEARAGLAVLERAGYEPSGIAAGKIGIGSRVVFAVRHRINRARFRVARYGLSLWLAQIVAHRLGSWFARFRAHVAMRTSAVDRLHWQ